MILVALAVSGFVGAVALALVVGRLQAPRLPPALLSPPRVQLLLPVRDEEENVGACLAALAAQTTPLAIRVLDDGSRDRTAAIVTEWAREGSTIELVAVPPPGAGASGKLHALAFGSRGVALDWILALDADSRPAPAAIAMALAAAQLNGLDAISLAARQRVGSVGEALVTPLVFALLDGLLGSWRASARGQGPPVGNGQFFLVRTAALDAIGGYPALAGELLDDVALARRLAAGGFRVGFWRAGRALEVRMYRGARSTFRGWRRNLSLILGDRPLLAGLVIAGALLPVLTATASLFAGEPIAALVALAGGITASALARAGTGSNPLWALLHPGDVLISSACLVTAVVDRQRGRVAPWRGRPLSLQPGSDPE